MVDNYPVDNSKTQQFRRRISIFQLARDELGPLLQKIFLKPERAFFVNFLLLLRLLAI